MADDDGAVAADVFGRPARRRRIKRHDSSVEATELDDDNFSGEASRSAAASSAPGRWVWVRPLELFFCERRTTTRTVHAMFDARIALRCNISSAFAIESPVADVPAGGAVEFKVGLRAQFSRRSIPADAAFEVEARQGPLLPTASDTDPAMYCCIKVPVRGAVVAGAAPLVRTSGNTALGAFLRRTA